MTRPPLPAIQARFSVNVVENAASELLLLKRSQKAHFAPGLWGFPAGHIEAGESPDDCALRELQEEIGEHFSIETLACSEAIRDSHFGGIYEIHLYHRRWLGGEVQLNEEHSDYAWVGKQQYQHYAVMDGIDEDIHYFRIWPLNYLNNKKIPPARINAPFSS